MENVVNPFAWELDFPPVYGHTSISFLKRCRGFEEAKHGDMRAALSVVNLCMKRDSIAALKSKYPNAVLLPVITKNKLPEALAEIVEMETHSGVRQIPTMSRKTLSAMERLLHKPLFTGKIMQGKSYIIVDDIVTQGGTVSALRRYVIIYGGSVAAVVALAFAVGGGIIAPDFRNINNLIDKFGMPLINDIIREFRIAGDIFELTNSQVRYLLGFTDAERLIIKISACSKILGYEKVGYSA